MKLKIISINAMKPCFKSREIETVSLFINECCYLSISAETKTIELYENYVYWCENTENLLFMVGKNKFITLTHSLLNKDGHVVKSYRTNKHRGLSGIGLLGA